jgi:8-oxo-dGTP diphosphatase
MIALIVAILLAVVLFPIGFVFSMFYPKRGKYLYRIALGIDQLGNVVCARLFNFFLIDADGYQFGNEDETISSVIGKNKQTNTLTMFGMLLDSLLEKIDKNHSIDAIEKNTIRKK